MLCSEQIDQAFENENSMWWNFDPRVEWLLDHLITHHYEKVLVICAKAEIALQLEHVLREREAIRVAGFHEGISIINRDHAATFFAIEESGGAKGAAVF